MIRVESVYDPVTGGASIYVLREYGQGREILRHGADGFPLWEPVEPAVEMDPTWRLPREVVGPLADALLDRAPSGDREIVRERLEIETDRVERMLDLLIRFASTPPHIVTGGEETYTP